MVQFASLIAAAALAVSSSAAAGERPVYLETHETPGGVELQIVGDAETATDAQYELHVSGGADGNANSTTQRGRSRLAPGRKVVLMTLRLGAQAVGHWSAQLHVTLAPGGEYDLSAGPSED